MNTPEEPYFFVIDKSENPEFMSKQEMVHLLLKKSEYDKITGTLRIDHFFTDQYKAEKSATREQTIVKISGFAPKDIADIFYFLEEFPYFDDGMDQFSFSDSITYEIIKPAFIQKENCIDEGKVVKGSHDRFHELNLPLTADVNNDEETLTFEEDTSYCRRNLEIKSQLSVDISSEKNTSRDGNSQLKTIKAAYPANHLESFWGASAGFPAKKPVQAKNWTHVLATSHPSNLPIIKKLIICL